MNADRIAGMYRWIEYAAFGRTLERCRFAALSDIADCRQVLILGEGDGRFLTRLLAVNPAARIDVIDRSEKMLALAEGRIPSEDRGRVNFLVRDATEWHGEGKAYDLIVTQFFLDCLSPDQAARLIPRLVRSLAPNGRWLICEFQQPARGWARVHAGVWLQTMYGFFRLTTGLAVSAIPPYQRILESAGCCLVKQYQYRFGLMAAQVWAAQS